MYPLPQKDLVFEYASRNNVDPYLVFAIIRVESKYDQRAESSRGAIGLMQIMPDTGRWIANRMDVKTFNEDMLVDPRWNIRMGTWYLANLESEFGDQLPLQIAAYNAGRGNVCKWLAGGEWDGDIDKLANIPFHETRQYVRNVVKTYEIYQTIYAEDGPASRVVR
jgi:soluble lytic murein transglycosylase